MKVGGPEEGCSSAERRGRPGRYGWESEQRKSYCEGPVEGLRDRTDMEQKGDGGRPQRETEAGLAQPGLPGCESLAQGDLATTTWTRCENYFMVLSRLQDYDEVWWPASHPLCCGWLWAWGLQEGKAR